MSELAAYLLLFRKEIKGRVFFNEPLSRHTTFCIGGPARVMVIPRDEEDLRKIFSLSRQYSLPYYILGNGSNILVNDRGVEGIVIKLDGPFSRINFKDRFLLAEGGAELKSLRAEASKRGLSGLEFTVGIPGTVAGAIAMNAGVSEEENIGRLVEKIEIMDKRGSLKTLNRRDLDFGYRSASIPAGAIILRAKLRLTPALLSDIKKKMYSWGIKRRRSQPLGEKSAGCVFKNPPEDSAGRLIDRAGLKGKSYGGASVSTLHANFIINQGQARAVEVLHLMKVIQRQVIKSFGIKLEPEIIIWPESNLFVLPLEVTACKIRSYPILKK